MALLEHPTLCYQPTSTTTRLVSSYTIAICMYSCFGRGIVISQQFHLNKGYLSSYCSTTGGVRAVHVSTAKFIQFSFREAAKSPKPKQRQRNQIKTKTKTHAFRSNSKADPILNDSNSISRKQQAAARITVFWRSL